MRNAVSVDNTCETRKIAMKNNDGSSMPDSDVIVLNPVHDSACNLQCAVGWYHAQHGNKAPFSCAPETKDRTLSEGIPTYPVICSGACVVSFSVNIMTHAYRNLMVVALEVADVVGCKHGIDL